MKKEIKQELLQEFVMPMLRDVKDAEGEYRRAFVSKILQAAQDDPVYTYHSKKFSNQVREK